MANVLPWASPIWNRYRGKHRAKQSASWNQIVKTTNNGPAKYRQDFTDSDHEELELRCIRTGTLIEEVGSVRSYYLDVGRIIGASNGLETSIVYAEHNRTGDVHGSPISPQELQRMGVTI
jgi:hypothetical protein